jgi:hypothetical protein
VCCNCLPAVRDTEAGWFARVAFRIAATQLFVKGKPVPSTRIASPERRWRALAALVIGALAGWVVSGSIHLGVRPAISPGLPLGARVGIIGAGAAIGVWLGILVLRTHLAVSDDGVADHRMLRVVRVPWPVIAGFEVGRPGGLWGGYCVCAVCRDGTTIDLMSTRAYSRVPSAQHLDELHRICWTLDEAAGTRA